MVWNLIKAADNKQTKIAFWPSQYYSCKQLKYKGGQEKVKVGIISKPTDFEIQQVF